MGVSRSYLMMATPKLWPPASPRTLGIITDEQSDAQFAQPEPQTYPPGVILREDVLPALCLTQTEFAQRLGISRLTVSEMVNEKRPVSVDRAIRLGKLLRNGAELWLRLQQALDVWELEQSGGYERIAPVEVKAA